MIYLKKHKLELGILGKEKKRNMDKIEYEEVKNLSYLSENDKKIFIVFDKMINHEGEKLKCLKNVFVT